MIRRSILKVDRNPTGIIQFGIDPFENRIVHPYEGKCISDYEGIETYEFDKPLLKCNSLRLNNNNRLINFWHVEDSDNYVLYKRIHDMDIPEYLITIDTECNIFKIDSDGEIIVRICDYIDKKFYDKIHDANYTYKIPDDLSHEEYILLMNIIQLSNINFRRIRFHYHNFDFNIGNRYFEHCYATFFHEYIRVNILGQVFYSWVSNARYLDPDKIFSNNLILYIGDHNLYYTLDSDKLDKIISKYEKRFGINVNIKDIKKDIINYHCDHTFENIRNYKEIYKRILEKLHRNLLYKAEEEITDEKIEEFVNDYGDIKVTLEDSLAVGNCEYGTRAFGKKYGFDEDNLPTVKELYNIMKENLNYSENIKLVLIYVMNKMIDDSED